ALVLALCLRAGHVGVPFVAEVRSFAAAVIGPVGFFLLGLSLSLERPAHAPVELWRAAGALAIRFAGAPLALLAVGHALGAHVPAVFYLLSAMPCAFHLLVLARVYDLRPALMRLLVVGPTVPAVAGAALGTADGRPGREHRRGRGRRLRSGAAAAALLHELVLRRLRQGSTRGGGGRGSAGRERVAGRGGAARLAAGASRRGAADLRRD